MASGQQQVVKTDNLQDPMWVMPRSLKESGAVARRRISSSLLMAACLAVGVYQNSSSIVSGVDKLGNSLRESIIGLMASIPDHSQRGDRNRHLIPFYKRREED